jgi:hypothetical protein
MDEPPYGLLTTSCATVEVDRELSCLGLARDCRASRMNITAKITMNSNISRMFLFIAGIFLKPPDRRPDITSFAESIG